MQSKPLPLSFSGNSVGKPAERWVRGSSAPQPEPGKSLELGLTVCSPIQFLELECLQTDPPTARSTGLPTHPFTKQGDRWACGGEK